MKQISCLVEVSARHIHLSEKDYDFLFGTDTPYKIIKKLSQIGEFATDKKLLIVGPEGELQARFLGPFREKTQVELSLTDCYQIGVKAPYQVEADNSATEIKIKGDNGEIVRNAAIVARRHLHISPRQAKDHGISKGSSSEISIESPRGRTSFSNLEIRIADNYRMSVHLDTDEGNAAGITGETRGLLEIEE